MKAPQPSIDALRDEFQRNDVRGWLWVWLRDHLRGHADARLKGRYRARIYSPTGEWDAAGVSDLVNGFIVDKGIGKGAVARALLTAVDTPGFVSYLEKSFYRYAISERPRSLSRNVFDRLRDVLDHQPDFIRLGGVPPHSLYGLADWEGDPPPRASDESLVGAGRHLPNDVEWKNYDTGTRQSPGISSHDIERIVRALLDGMGLLLTARQIMTVISQRYPLLDDLSERTTRPLDHAVVASEDDPLERAEAADLATRAFEAFTPRQREIVRLMLEDPSAISARALAPRLNVSKSTAANELRAIQSRFRLLGATSEDIQRQILDSLGPLLKAS